jgi:hypothetical protein
VVTFKIKQKKLSKTLSVVHAAKFSRALYSWLQEDHHATTTNTKLAKLCLSVASKGGIFS